MGILDYIFKSKEQREKEAKEAEEKHDSEVFSKADKLRKEGKNDEALELYMQIDIMVFQFQFVTLCSYV